MALNRFRLGFGGGGATNSPTIHPLTAGLPAGATFTRASSQTVADFEAILQTVGSNVPAFTGARLVDASTWSALDTEGAAISEATLLGYLSEPTGTNYCFQSEAINVAPWGVLNAGTGIAPVITPNAAVAPDGTTTAERVQFDRGAGTDGGDYSLVYQTNSSLSSAVYHLNPWFKSNTGGNQNVLLYNGAASVGTDLVVTPEWQQVHVHGETPLTEASLVFGTRGDTGSPFNSGGDQTLDILVWGGQISNVDGSYIPTTSGSASRAGTVANIPMSKITAAKGAVELTVTPLGEGQTGVIWSSYVDADNYTEIAATATTVVINKRVAATTYTATATYSHAAGTAFAVKAAWDNITGLFVKVDSGTAGTHANTANAQLAVDNTCQAGSRNGGSHFAGNYKNLKFYARKPSSWS